MEIEGEREEIKPALGVAVGVDGDVPRLIDPEVALTPAAHVVELLGVPGGPGRRGNDSGDGSTPGRSKRGKIMSYRYTRQRGHPRAVAQRRHHSPTCAGGTPSRRLKRPRAPRRPPESLPSRGLRPTPPPAAQAARS